jgi:hypothetical protein
VEGTGAIPARTWKETSAELGTGYPVSEPKFEPGTTCGSRASPLLQVVPTPGI